MKLEGDFWDQVRKHPGYAESKRWQERYGMTAATHMDNAVIVTCEPARCPPPPTRAEKVPPFYTVRSEERTQQQRSDAQQWQLWYTPLEELHMLLTTSARWFRENSAKLDAEQRALAEKLETWGQEFYIACLRHDRVYWPVRYPLKEGSGTLVDSLHEWFPPVHERAQRRRPEPPPPERMWEPAF